MPYSSRLVEGVRCGVCSDHSSGRHYGIFTCDGCAGFFKRSIWKNRKYRCKGKRGEVCMVDKVRRNQCRFCRLEKCFEAGMNKNAVQHERGRKNNKRKLAPPSPYQLHPSPHPSPYDPNNPSDYNNNHFYVSEDYYKHKFDQNQHSSYNLVNKTTSLYDEFLRYNRIALLNNSTNNNISTQKPSKKSFMVKEIMREDFRSNCQHTANKPTGKNEISNKYSPSQILQTNCDSSNRGFGGKRHYFSNGFFNKTAAVSGRKDLHEQIESNKIQKICQPVPVRPWLSSYIPQPSYHLPSHITSFLDHHSSLHTTPTSNNHPPSHTPSNPNNQQPLVIPPTPNHPPPSYTTSFLNQANDIHHFEPHTTSMRNHTQKPTLRSGSLKILRHSPPKAYIPSSLHFSQSSYLLNSTRHQSNPSSSNHHIARNHTNLPSSDHNTQTRASSTLLKCINWLKCLPALNKLCLNDRISLVRESWTCLFVLFASQTDDLVKDENKLNGIRNEDGMEAEHWKSKQIFKKRNRANFYSRSHHDSQTYNMLSGRVEQEDTNNEEEIDMEFDVSIENQPVSSNGTYHESNESRSRDEQAVQEPDSTNSSCRMSVALMRQVVCKLQEYHLDPVEHSCLLEITLFKPLLSKHPLEEPSLVAELQDHAHQRLNHHVTSLSRPMHRFGKILLALPLIGAIDGAVVQNLFVDRAPLDSVVMDMYLR